jgi:hypothetical protein
MRHVVLGALAILGFGFGFGCGGARSSPAGPAATSAAAMTAADCFAILASEVGAASDAALGVERRLPPEEDGAYVTEIVDAEALVLRGDPAATICVVSRKSDRAPCTECAPEERTEDATHVVAVVADRRVTDQQTLSSSRADLMSRGFPQWHVEPIGPGADALVVTEHDESGDTSLARVAWYTVAAGKLVEQFSYQSGIESGRTVAEVSYEIGRDAADGHYPIVFTVKEVPEDEPDADAVPAEQRTCRWKAATATYDCDPQAP